MYYILCVSITNMSKATIISNIIMAAQNIINNPYTLYNHAYYRPRTLHLVMIKTVDYRGHRVPCSNPINPHSPEVGLYLYKPWRPKVFFQFEIIINVLVSFLRFISLQRPLWVYILYFTDFRRQNLTSTDVRF